MEVIQNKKSIKEALLLSFEAVKSTIEGLPAEALHFKTATKWTVAENLSHLILSTFPVASALNKTKALFLMFGTSKSGSRSYADLQATYKETLQQNPNLAGSGYEPKEEAVADVSKMLENWQMIGAKFEKRLDKWSESDLDKYRIPHPLLGKLTFREMLFFTNFHNHIHLEIIRQRLNEYGQI